jgi:hypothetical protein
MCIRDSVHSYQVRDNFSISIQDFNIVSEFKNGPVPKMNKKSIMGDVNGLDMRNKNIVTVSDNVSIESFLDKLNSPPDPLNVTEMITVSSIVDVGGRSVPGNYKDLFYQWWDQCVSGGDEFTINLQDIGATLIPITLNVERSVNRDNLTVKLTIEGYSITVKFDLTRTIGSCLMKEPNGAYIFFSGKKIGNAFFELFNPILRDPAVDTRSPPNLEHLINQFAHIVSSSAGLDDVDKATQGTLNLFRHLDYNYPLIGKFFLVGKLIGDLLCPLSCDNDWYTLTNDKPLVARCVILEKKALFKYTKGNWGKLNYVSGFYYFIPSHPPRNPAPPAPAPHAPAPPAPAIDDAGRRIRLSIEFGEQVNILLETQIRTVNDKLDREIRFYMRNIIRLDKPFTSNTESRLKYKKELCLKSIRNDVKKLFKSELSYQEFQTRIQGMTCSILPRSQTGGQTGVENNIIVKWKKERFDIPLPLKVDDLKFADLKSIILSLSLIHI